VPDDLPDRRGSLYCEGMRSGRPAVVAQPVAIMTTRSRIGTAAPSNAGPPDAIIGV